jgi:hypothetical protein
VSTGKRLSICILYMSLNKLTIYIYLCVYSISTHRCSSAVALVCYLLEHYHEELFSLHGSSGLSILSDMMSFLKVLMDDKDDVVKFQAQKAGKMLTGLATGYLGPVGDDVHDDLHFLRVCRPATATDPLVLLSTRSAARTRAIVELQQGSA